MKQVKALEAERLSVIYDGHRTRGNRQLANAAYTAWMKARESRVKKGKVRK